MVHKLSWPGPDVGVSSGSAPGCEVHGFRGRFRVRQSGGVCGLCHQNATRPIRVAREGGQESTSVENCCSFGCGEDPRNLGVVPGAKASTILIGVIGVVLAIWALIQ